MNAIGIMNNNQFIFIHGCFAGGKLVKHSSVERNFEKKILQLSAKAKFWQPLKGERERERERERVRGESRHNYY